MFSACEGTGSFFRGNLHCHSTGSDGDMSPERVCHFYREAGYDFICLSDHFLDRYNFPVTDTAPFRTDAFTTLLGSEIHSGKTEADEIWHLLAVGLPTDFAPTKPDETGPELAQRALDAGAFVAVPHPQWYGLTLGDVQSLPDGIHAMEVFNGICSTYGRGGGDHLLDTALTAGRMLGAIAVDDAHRYQGDALRGWVMVRAETLEPAALLTALKSGAYYASTGVEIFHAERHGDFLMVETSPAVHIALIGKGARSEVVSGNNLRRAKLSLEKFSGTWCRLVIQSADGTRAWANPFHVA